MRMLTHCADKYVPFNCCRSSSNLPKCISRIKFALGGFTFHSSSFHSFHIHSFSVKTPICIGSWSATCILCRDMYSELIVNGYRTPDMRRSVIESDFARAGSVGMAPASSISIGIGWDGSRVIGISTFWC